MTNYIINDNQISDATMKIIARVGKQTEFKEAWERLENAERSYICGDIFNLIKSVFVPLTDEHTKGDLTMCGDSPDSEPYCQWCCLPRRVCTCEKGKPAKELIKSAYEMAHQSTSPPCCPGGGFGEHWTAKKAREKQEKKIRQDERKNLLDELMVWTKQNTKTYKDVDGDNLPAIITGRLMLKIESLRSKEEPEYARTLIVNQENIP